MTAMDNNTSRAKGRAGGWTQDDDALAELGVEAGQRDAGREFLHLPGEVIVAERDVDAARDALKRRGWLRDDENPAQPPPVDAAPTTSIRRLDVRLASLLRLRRIRITEEVVHAIAAPSAPASFERPPSAPEREGGDDQVLADLGLGRLLLRADIDAGDVAAALRREGLDVAPNHVLHMEPMYMGMPGSLPAPAEEIAPPQAPAGNRRPIVAVLDTGIQRGWHSDAWFADRVDGVGAHDDEILDADRDHVLDLQAGHGTFIASLVAQRCPDARIVPRRVLNSHGLCDDVRLAVAIRRIADVKPDVLVLSLGCYAAEDRPPPAITAALATLPASTVVVAAAGNAGTNRLFWPAALKQVVAVGAHDGKRPARFSNHGWWVDACADGVDVHARFVEFDGGVQGVTDAGDFPGFAVWSGTSFSAPIVAGIIAQVMCDAGLGAPDAARKVLHGARGAAVNDLGVRVD